MAKIERIKLNYYKVPLKGNLVDALHGKHINFELIIVLIYLADGREGIGYTYTGGIGGKAVMALLENDLVPQLIGQEFIDPYLLNEYMTWHIHYVARGGIASFAISALDIAFWDIFLKTKSLALKDIYGVGVDRVRTYYGGIDLMLTEYELLKNIEEQLKRGHTGIKIKVGRENESEDISRVRAVRRLIGEDALFMVDANMVWTVSQAIHMIKRLEEFHPVWIEEPINPDDLDGYATIIKSTSIPISMGENLHTFYEHKLAITIGHIECPIIDCSNVCGITGFFKASAFAELYHYKVNSHGMQEMHCNVLGALKNRGFVEFHSFPIYEYTVNPPVIKNGYIPVSEECGIGVQFDWERLKRFKA